MADAAADAATDAAAAGDPRNGAMAHAGGPARPQHPSGPTGPTPVSSEGAKCVFIPRARVRVGTKAAEVGRGRQGRRTNEAEKCTVRIQTTTTTTCERCGDRFAAIEQVCDPSPVVRLGSVGRGRAGVAALLGMLLGLGLGLASDSSFKGQWFVRAGMILWVKCKVRSVRRSAFGVRRSAFGVCEPFYRETRNFVFFTK